MHLKKMYIIMWEQKVYLMCRKPERQQRYCLQQVTQITVSTIPVIV